ncbi:MAG: carboxypeptidase regulatory-like domain-containing protein [Acidobacteria bacterium]|nr:carboxypeptidase regulatory-like domain-containing protein [Acidobacteriota bacterium]
MIDALKGLWRRYRGRGEDDFPESPYDDPELRHLLVRHALRIAAIFFVVFGAVFFAFRWSGAAVRFGAMRAAGAAAPTWRVTGVIRDARTGEPIPWASVEDDPAGRPPLFRADADIEGRYDLLTLAEPHRLRVSAPGYRTRVLRIGRIWYLWLPRGEERSNPRLDPSTDAPK